MKNINIVATKFFDYTYGKSNNSRDVKVTVIKAI